MKKQIFGLGLIVAAIVCCIAANAEDTQKNAVIEAQKGYFENLYYCTKYSGTDLPGAVKKAKRTMQILGRNKNLCETKIETVDENDNIHGYECSYPYGVYQKISYDMLSLFTNTIPETGINVNYLYDIHDKYCKYYEKTLPQQYNVKH